MATSRVNYLGELRCENTHIASGNSIVTDAPTDNHGKGEAFSPTDLLATSLASCMITIMGIAAEAHGFSVEGTTAEVTKIMATNPRRVGEVQIVLTMPSKAYSSKEKKMIEKAAYSCPVFESLHPDLTKKITFIWG